MSENETKQIRLEIAVSSTGGLSLTCTDLDQNPHSRLIGKASTVEFLVCDFDELGLKDQAKDLRSEKLPDKDSARKICYILPDTEEVMAKLGFKEPVKIIG
jgi:hypothetical protein